LIQTLDQDELAGWRGANLGIVYQSFELMPSLNLIENVVLPPDFSGNYHPENSREKALELLELVGLEEHARKIPAHISGGQKQRVAIARALVNDPPLIVADEPTGNLDTVTAESVLSILEELVSRGKTIVLVTHDESLAGRFSRRLEISDGRLGPSNGHGPSSSAQPPSEASRRFYRAAGLANPSDSSASRSGSIRDAAAQVSAGAARPAHPAILLRDVTKVYEGPAGTFTALKSVDLELPYGQFVSVVGKSGSGKSTLLNMITGIDHPTSGEVLVANQPIYAMNESRRAQWRGRTLGIVFQFFQLLPTLSLLENTMLPMDYCDAYPFGERPDRAMDLLRMVGLEDQAEKLPANVSSGQQQSAAIARALATDPPIILADEPTGNLDSRSAGVILDLFESLASSGKTVVIVTHDPAITRRTHQTVILSDGEIVDQTVAHALPFLSHPQMLVATHRARKVSYSAGTTILRQGEPVDHLSLVARGEVEIVLPDDRGGEMRLARLGQGQFFGEVELTRGVNSIASVRAASHEPVELALLPGSEFHRLIDESSEAREVLEEVAGARLAENYRRRTNVR
jgi:ABC-type lipoprotein export system ATPase subunit